MAASEEPITVYGHVKDSPAGGALDKLSQVRRMRNFSCSPIGQTLC